MSQTTISTITFSGDNIQLISNNFKQDRVGSILKITNMDNSMFELFNLIFNTSKIDLSNCNLSSEQIITICRTISWNPKITVLNLEGNNITSNEVKEICNVINSTSLTELYLKDSPIGNEGLKILGNTIEKNPNLQVLSIINCNCEIGEDFSNALIKNNVLTTIILDDNKINLAYFKNVIENNRNLLVLSIKNCQTKISDNFLTSFNKNNFLTTINFDNNKIDFLLQSISKSIIELSINNTEIVFFTELYRRRFISELSKPNIEKLFANNFKCIKTGIKNKVDLSGLIKNKTLKHLVLSNNDYNDEDGIKIATNLKENTSLKILNLEGNNISEPVKNLIKEAWNSRSTDLFF